MGFWVALRSKTLQTFLGSPLEGEPQEGVGTQWHIFEQPQATGMPISIFETSCAIISSTDGG